MANLMGDLVGSGGVAKMIGQQVGDGVEKVVGQVLSKGNDGKEEQKGGAGGFGGMLSSLSGKKEDDNSLAKGAMNLLSGFK